LPGYAGRYEGYLEESAELRARLLKRGYSIHPIAIDEGAVEKAAREICREEHLLRFGAHPFRAGELKSKVEIYWREHIPAARTAISTYLEAVRAK
jgi:hypothetical protein